MPSESSKDLLAYTPMIHARMFAEQAKFRDHSFQPTRSGLASVPDIGSTLSPSVLYLDGNTSVDRPLIVQFCANSPDELLEAARYVQPFCDAIDLNLGCPQGIARRGQYGAFLQDDWDLIYRMINKLHTSLEVPITAKIRILETRERTLEYAKVILSAGASIITVHGRHRDQKGHKTGLADWSVLRYLRDNLPRDTVIFANGNILQHDDIGRCLEETRADGVMSAEGNLYDPTIFAKPPEVGKEGREYWRGRNQKGGYRVDAVFRRYMDILYQYVIEKPSPPRKPLFIPSDPTTVAPSSNLQESGGNEANDQPPAKRQKIGNKPVKETSPNLLSMQAHLFHLLRPLVSKHTDVRDELARCRAGNIAAFENVLHMTEQAVKKGLLEYELDPAKYDDETSSSEISNKEQQVEDCDKDASPIAMVKTCKRPWWVCQPYVRPLPEEALEKGSLTLSKKERKNFQQNLDIQGLPSQSVGTFEREKVESADGVPNGEMPREGMVCG